MRFIKLFLFCLFLLTATKTFSQTETYDITTFIPPKGWDRKEGDSGLAFSKVDSAAGKFCLIAIYPSIESSGEIETDFGNEWQNRVSKPLETKAKPEMQKLPTKDGWNVLLGVAKIQSDGKEMATLLTVFNNSERAVSILISLSDMSFEKDFSDFLGSLKFAKSSTTLSIKSRPPMSSGSSNSLIGNWGDVTSGSFGIRNSSGSISTGRGGSFRSYDFKADGTYTCVMSADIVLNGSRIQTHETGKYSVTGETLTLSPIKIIYRRNGVDETPNADWRNPRTYKWRIEKDGAATNLVLITGTFEDRFLWNR
jgi:hypothetical protein